MAPRLAEGDRIVVKAVSPRALAPGDVIVFESDSAGFVVHRLVWRDRPLGQPSRLYTRGDALGYFDHAVPMERVLGRVVSVEREGKRVRPTTLRDRARCILLAARHGFRQGVRRALAGRGGAG